MVLPSRSPRMSIIGAVKTVRLFVCIFAVSMVLMIVVVRSEMIVDFQAATVICRGDDRVRWCAVDVGSGREGVACTGANRDRWRRDSRGA